METSEEVNKEAANTAVLPATTIPAVLELPAEVVAELKKAGLSDPEMIKKVINDLGLTEKSDIGYLTKEGLMSIEGMKEIAAEKLLVALGLKKPPGSQAGSQPNPISLDMLPKPLSDESLLAALKAGGVIQVEESTIISAIRAALAAEFNLFELPDKLLILMESYAKRGEKPVDKKYWEIRKIVIYRSYAEIFEGLGIDGKFVTDPRKKELFGRIDKYLWPSLLEFQEHLEAWQKLYVQYTMSMYGYNQQIMGSGAPVTGMMPPDAGPVIDASESVINNLNKIFADLMVPITAAVALEAMRIKKILENKDLPPMIGAANREEMLRLLEAAVPATSPRMEDNITRFVLAILHLKDQTTGREMNEYLNAMFVVGSQIPWSQFRGIGAKKTDTDEDKNSRNKRF